VVARGDDYQDAARAVGRRSGDAVSHLIARFNVEGLAALAPRHDGGRRPTYGRQDRVRILTEASRAPTLEAEGTSSWSLSTLQRTLRTAPDGLPMVSTYTIRRVLHESGCSYQRTRMEIGEQMGRTSACDWDPPGDRLHRWGSRCTRAYSDFLDFFVFIDSRNR
jgi:transposase